MDDKIFNKNNKMNHPEKITSIILNLMRESEFFPTFGIKELIQD